MSFPIRTNLFLIYHVALQNIPMVVSLPLESKCGIVCIEIEFVRVTYRFEDFVHQSLEARCETELLGHLTKALEQQGYEQIVFAIFNEPDISAASHSFGYYEHAVEEWNRLYTESDYVRIDPVVRAVKAGAKAFTWDDLPKFFSMTRPQQQYMSLVGELGMHQGMAVTLAGGRAGVGLSTADKSDRRPGDVAMASAICTHFYQAFRDLKSCTTSPAVGPESLSIKEREVLIWVAAGKTDFEIAQILDISQSTVDAHLRSVFRKLGHLIAWEP